MPQLKVYENNVETYIPCAVMNSNDLSDIPSGSSTRNGWTVTKNVSQGFMHFVFFKNSLPLPSFEDLDTFFTETLLIRTTGLLEIDTSLYTTLDATEKTFKISSSETYPEIGARYYTYDSWRKRSYYSFSKTNRNYFTVYADTGVDDPRSVIGFAGAVLSTANYTSGYLGGIQIEKNVVIGGTSSVRIEMYFESDTYYPDIVEPIPGVKGFRPTADYTSKNVPGTGGRGTANKPRPEYATDVITQPGEPNEEYASAIGLGLLTLYDVTEANLQELAKCLYSGTLLSAIMNLTINPLDAIVSLNIFPYTPKIGESIPIKLLNHVCLATDLGVNASGFPLTHQFRTVDFGTVQIPENWGNFLDYSETRIELYLPFIGSVDLAVGECMNGSVNVQYTIDYLTGMCVANVLCTKNVKLPNGLYVPNTAQHSYQGNCAIQIPLSQVGYSNMVGNLINACTTGLANPMAGGIKVLSDTFTGGMAPTVSTKGSIVGNAGYCSVLYPYIRITRPITAESESYQTVIGYPSHINTALNQCEDLCICDSIDLHSVTGATDSEIERIRQMCLEGVHV